MNMLSRFPLLLAAGLALGAGACATSAPPAAEALNARTPADQFPFKVGEELDDTLLAVHATGVSANQAAALDQALARWRQTGGDAIVVRVPVGNAQDGAASAMAHEVQAGLLSRGVAPGLVRLERYEAGADGAAPLVVGFSRFRAAIPACGEKWDNLTGTQSNGVHSNFGCAISANMAAQVANPRDLVQARAADTSDAARTALQVSQHHQGVETASAAKNGNGQISNAVK